MKTKSLFTIMCALAVAAISTALLAQPTSWNMDIEAAYAQTTGNNTSEVINITENIQHWERIDFIVTSPEPAAKLGVSSNMELNVKFAGNPNSVEDMRQAVLDFFNANTTESDKSSIQILGSVHDVICAQYVKAQEIRLKEEVIVNISREAIQ